MQKLPTFFSKNISIYPILHDQSFNDMLTNKVSSLEQLDPERLLPLYFLRSGCDRSGLVRWTVQKNPYQR